MGNRFNPLKRRGGHAKTNFSLDLSRSLIFLIYGGFYQGVCNEFIHGDILPLLGRGTDVGTVARKVIVDMGLICPFVCIPMAYLIKGFLVGNTIFVSLTNYLSDVVNKGVVFKNWCIFVPVQCLTFSVIPEPLGFVCGLCELLLDDIAFVHNLFLMPRAFKLPLRKVEIQEDLELAE